jgi:hypothetical protein
MMDITKIIPNTGLSKRVIETTAQGIIESIKNGDADPIKILIAFKAVEKVAEEVGDFVKDTCIDKADQYKGEAFYGVKVRTQATRAFYDMESDEEFRVLKAKLKAREELLKEAIKAKSGRALTPDGEVVEAPPLLKPQGQTIVLTFNKE